MLGVCLSISTLDYISSSLCYYTGSHTVAFLVKTLLTQYCCLNCYWYPAVEQHPIQLGLTILYTASCFGETGDKRRPDGPQGLSEDFALTLTLAISCILKGPVTIKACPMSKQILRIFLSVSSFRSCGGRTMVASPECTPAFSTCSETAMTTTSPSQATASTSIS